RSGPRHGGARRAARAQRRNQDRPCLIAFRMAPHSRSPSYVAQTLAAPGPPRLRLQLTLRETDHGPARLLFPPPPNPRRPRRWAELARSTDRPYARVSRLFRVEWGRAGGAG